MSLSINTSNRVSGMSSGIDTESVVEGMMTAYQTKLDRQSQYTDKMEWKAEGYREINTLIKNFRSKYMSVLSSTNMLSESAYANNKVTINTATSAVSITASSAAGTGTMTIDSITQLAEAASLSSKNVFTGTTYTSDTTLANFSLTNAFQFDENDELSFTINDQQFTFTKDTTVAAMMKEINSSDAGVTMRFSSLTKGFSITASATGSANGIEIVNLTGNAFASENSALGIAQGTLMGKDAILSIEGTAVTQSSNTFTFDGITYTLGNTSSTPIDFTVSEDYQATVDSITSFVDAYNELVGTLQGKLEEKVYYKYPPLTDAQREEMSDEEIESWEKYAKSGMLTSDSYISSMLTSLRGAFYTTVEGTGMKMSDIGLTTGLYSDGAKITVDKDKLLNALKTNPDKVKNMFTQTSSTDNSEEEGLLVRISDAMLDYTKNTTSVALDSLEDRIDESEETEDDLKTYITDREEKLWSRFSAMEAALTKLNSMSGWISSLFPSS